MPMRYFNQLLHYIERLDFHQTALLSIAVVSFGFFCMLGFGSRSKY